MSSGWVPPVVSAVKEYGQAAGCVAPSYIQMCVRCLVALVACCRLPGRPSVPGLLKDQSSRDLGSF